MIGDISGWLGLIAALLTIAGVVYSGIEDRRYIRSLERLDPSRKETPSAIRSSTSSLGWALRFIPVFALGLASYALALWSQDLRREATWALLNDQLRIAPQLEASANFVLVTGIGVAVVGLLIIARVTWSALTSQSRSWRIDWSKPQQEQKPAKTRRPAAPK